MEKTIDLAGVKLNDITSSDMMGIIEELFDMKSLNTIETITMKTVVAAGTDDKVRECLEKTDLVLPADKEMLAMAGVTLPEKLNAVENKDFFYTFMRIAVERKLTFFLISQTAEEMETLMEFLDAKYENHIRILGNYAFEMCEGDDADIVNEINTELPDIILSILPTPLQEQFLFDHHAMFNACIWYGVGRESDVTESHKGLKSWLKRKQYSYKVKQKVQSGEEQ